MGTKTRTVARGEAAEGEQVSRLLRKQRYRQAVKAARKVWRAVPSADNRRLLEEALAERIEQLQARALPDHACSLVREWLSLGEHSSDIRRRLQPVMLRLGMADEALALADDEVDERLEADLADTAVSDPSVLPSSRSAMRGEVEAVRLALDHVAAGEDEQAQQALREIPRRSPLAAWRLLVRGLIAFYRDDDEAAAAAWDRIDPARAPARIAARLHAVHASDREAAEQAAVALERAAGQLPVVPTLIALRQSVHAHDWPAVRRVLGEIRRQARGESGLALRRQVTAALYDDLVAACAEGAPYTRKLPRQVESVLKMLEPLQTDPTWDRFRALAFERVGDGPEPAMAAWERYTAVIAERGLFGAQCGLARSLVSGRMADMAAEEAMMIEGPARPNPFLPSPTPPEWVDGYRDGPGWSDALELARRSVQACPEHVPGHERLAEVCRSIGDAAGMAAAYERLLEQDPHHVRARRELALHYLGEEDPEAAFGHLSRLRELTPLDRQVSVLLYRTRMNLARRAIEAGHADAARAAVAEAEAAVPEMAEQPAHLVRKAFLERKAGCAEQAEAMLAEAEQGVAEPGAWALMLSVEANRWGLPPKQRRQYMARWKPYLRGRTRAARAAAMAEALTPYTVNRIVYDGIQEHLCGLLDYLRRSARTAKYRREQMEQVCRFLDYLASWGGPDDLDEAVLAEAKTVFSRIGEKAVARFPDSAICNALHVQALLMESAAPWRVGSAVHRTLELTGGSEDPHLQAVHERMRRLESMLEGMMEMGPMGPMGSMGPMGPAAPEGSPLADMLDEIAATRREDPQTVVQDLFEQLMGDKVHPEELDAMDPFGLNDAFDEDDRAARPATAGPGGRRSGSRRR